MDCKEARPLLTEYIDGTLCGAESKPLEAHIKVCAVCLDELMELLGVHESLQAAFRFKAPAGFAARVIERLPEAPPLTEAAADTALPGRLRGPVPVPLMAKAAAVAFAIITGVLSGGFLYDELLARGNGAALETQDRIFASASLDYLDPAPPESIAGAYLANKENGNEK